MDWLRIAAFVLLILYHIGFMFTPWGYQTPSRGVVQGIDVFLLALSPWRLSLLFAISGYASAAMLERGQGTGAFFRSRMMRLAVPLAFGILVIVPPQPWVGAMRDTGYTGSYLAFLANDYSPFQYVNGIMVPRWIHLWFVAYLLVYTGVLCGLTQIPDTVKSRVAQGFERILAGPLLLPLPIVFIFCVRLLGHGWTDTHRFVDDFAAHAHYFAMFLFGVLLRGSPPLLAAIARQWRFALVTAAIGYGLIVVCKMQFPGDAPLPDRLELPFGAAKALLGWSAIVALFGIANRYWNHDAPIRATLVEAVFPFYIIHQTIYIGTGWWLNDFGLGAPGEFLVLLGATTFGCIAFYLAGREIPLLRPLIGLGPDRRVGQHEPEPATA
jgi:glucans biosynthesis protein C